MTRGVHNEPWGVCIGSKFVRSGDNGTQVRQMFSAPVRQMHRGAEKETRSVVLLAIE